MSISDYPEIIPDEIEHGDRNLRLVKAQKCSRGWAAAVFIEPPIVADADEPSVALGYGGAKHEAIIDAFDHAKDALRGN